MEKRASELLSGTTGIAVAVEAQRRGADALTAGALGEGAKTVMGWLDDALSGRPHEGTRRGVVDAFEHLAAAIDRLSEVLRSHGTKLDQLDALDRDATCSTFARETANAPTPEKREALVNVAARQWDPRSGRAQREFWFRLTAGLTDHQLHVLRALRTGGVLFHGREWGTTPVAPGATSQGLVPFVGSEHEVRRCFDPITQWSEGARVPDGVSVAEWSADEALAIRTECLALIVVQPPLLCIVSSPTNSRGDPPERARGFALTQLGRRLLAMIDDIAGEG